MVKDRRASGKFAPLDPNLQVSFYYKLQAIRKTCLDESLRQTVLRADVQVIDAELSKYVSKAGLTKVASFGLRGEVFFPVPVLLELNPHLLGYYRLLLGLSQKEFYNKGPFGPFKKMEDAGEISKAAAPQILQLCRSLIATAERMVESIDQLSLAIVNDLQILTLGAQLRGSENTRLGQEATQEVFDLIKAIASRYIKEMTNKTILIENDSKRPVIVQFSSDPDISITQKLGSEIRPLVSIEIKGGADQSNVHNRIGEAEKSHQKAKQKGFFEFWTILRCDLPLEQAKRGSPTTSHFFNLANIAARGADRDHFRHTLCSILGIQS